MDRKKAVIGKDNEKPQKSRRLQLAGHSRDVGSPSTEPSIKGLFEHSSSIRRSSHLLDSTYEQSQKEPQDYVSQTRDSNVDAQKRSCPHCNRTFAKAFSISKHVLVCVHIFLVKLVNCEAIKWKTD